MDKIKKLNQIVELLKEVKKQTEEYDRSFEYHAINSDLFEWNDSPYRDDPETCDLLFYQVVDRLLNSLEEEKEKYLRTKDKAWMQ